MGADSAIDKASDHWLLAGFMGDLKLFWRKEGWCRRGGAHNLPEGIVAVGDVVAVWISVVVAAGGIVAKWPRAVGVNSFGNNQQASACLLYTSDAADE